MISEITSIESLEAPIRSILLKQSELDGNHVLNALGIRGPAMEKPSVTQGEFIFESMSVSESVLIFELYEKSSNSEDDVNDEDIFTYLELGLKLIVYGKDSRTLSQMLKARLLSAEVRDELFKIGLNLKNVSEIESASEYVNDVLWQRRDFEISLSCRMNTQKISKDKSFELANSIDVVEVNQ